MVKHLVIITNKQFKDVAILQKENKVEKRLEKFKYLRGPKK